MSCLWCGDVADSFVAGMWLCADCERELRAELVDRPQGRVSSDRRLNLRYGCKTDRSDRRP